MKALRLTLLTALLGSTAAHADLVSLAGDYQALLYSGSDDTDTPAGLVALKVTSKGAASGKLTTPDKKVYSFKTKLTYNAGVAIPEGDITISRGKTLPALDLKNLTLTEGETAADTTLSVDLDDGAPVGTTENGFKVKTYIKPATAPILGNYTVAFELADDYANAPSGSGYAVAKIDAKGVMKLTGATGDGTKFTASLPNGPDNQFVFFANPYKRDDSFFAGKIALSARAGGGFHMTPSELPPTLPIFDAQWKKAGLAKDKSYRDGFPALDVMISVEPWTIPSSGETVASLFGIVDGKLFEVDYGFEVPAGSEADYVSINEKNIVYPATGDGVLSPDALIKVFSGKVNPKTGMLTATLNLQDSVMVNNKPKTIKRKVTIQGVLVKLVDATEEDAFAAGFALLPPLAKGDPMTAHSVSFANIQDNPVAQEINSSGFALNGTYQAYFDWEHDDPSLTPPSSIPANHALVEFSISADLKTLSFNGRTLILDSYSILPGSISTVVYKDMKNFKDNITATIRFTSEEMTKCDVSYTEVKGRSSRFRSALSRNNPNTIVKLP